MDGYDSKATTSSQLDRIRGVSRLPKNRAFAVSVVNTTFRPLSFGRMRDRGDDQWGPWFPIPKVSQNCFGSAASCIADGLWDTIFVVDADDSPFELQLISEPDENGNAYGGTWTVTPTRETAGQIIVAAL